VAKLKGNEDIPRTKRSIVSEHRETVSEDQEAEMPADAGSEAQAEFAIASVYPGHGEDRPLRLRRKFTNKRIQPLTPRYFLPTWFKACKQAILLYSFTFDSHLILRTFWEHNQSDGKIFRLRAHLRQTEAQPPSV
jgi:hypothetical protein